MLCTAVLKCLDVVTCKDLFTVAVSARCLLVDSDSSLQWELNSSLPTKSLSLLHHWKWPVKWRRHGVIDLCLIPLQYLVMMLGIFAVMAWLGSVIDNLFLTYLVG